MIDHESYPQASPAVADLIDCPAQREAYRRATELIGPALALVGGRMSAGAVDGIGVPQVAEG
ncbi:hypothetical protein [Azospirillum picis]|uniref:Uncharacterized protein n=1 Tax=Azospirillum picis TaxID=488438 RepID=A0ABU0MSY3_9PROT|nr:hypothetical protein [Azospirillum picis]MBP2302537.1 hypothetical protein [Azospirillum picis]MDQ0536221.1 hypothetical protein [Azospirillum picis]